MSGGIGRLYRGETTFNFFGRRWWGFGISIALMVITVLSLFTRGLNLGMDFQEGMGLERGSGDRKSDLVRRGTAKTSLNHWMTLTWVTESVSQRTDAWPGGMVADN